MSSVNAGTTCLSSVGSLSQTFEFGDSDYCLVDSVVYKNRDEKIER